MIPKILHYCWLSGDPFPDSIKSCMETWKTHLPDWEIILWDQNRFDISSVPYVAQACKHKKWAFAADYIRLHALHHTGGLYLDSDVSLYGDISKFLRGRFFAPIEYHSKIVESKKTESYLNKDGSPTDSSTSIPGIGIQAAIMASEPAHPLIGSCLAWYKDRDFTIDDGAITQKDIAPTIFAKAATQYGFKYKNINQILSDGIEIYSNKHFAGTKQEKNNESIAVHNCEGSWRMPKEPPIKEMLRRIFT